MARIEHICEDAAIVSGQADGEMYFRMGLMHANGRGAVPDFVEAHKWFNIAAMRGEQRAVALRRELSEEMTSDQIAAAQRAAREWLSVH
ncbi:SEL1-like repeat protein [Tepidamorphus sp. 3E244]|uniref:SEL1-like repeat protein n=1 Tax=Tepidamorphus sp. 3E244 TaxID=3385498 RepID=UPI0038FC6D76